MEATSTHTSEPQGTVTRRRYAVAFAVIYGLAYALLILVAACVAFERKDFN